MIYTTGYTGLKVEKLIAKMDELDAYLIDIRLKPWSRNPVYSQSSLIKMFKDRYIAGGEYFGNLNYKASIEHTEIKNFEGGLDFIEKFLKNDDVLIFMCMCREYDKCHRKIIAEKIRKMGVKIEELNYDPPKEVNEEVQLGF